ncbi:nucleotidyl transferase AbiEii/AbiGii toxin family protein [Candidatus Gottesmanbacteria bacterium]|nr:nucleotidyl transferase AbiEii/AbiGii toxin family protein [Candidatus Gottesmanbacteria bacterium]
MILSDLQTVVTQNKNLAGPSYLRNLLKEILQFYTLNFIYSSRWGKDFLFKGGTCLRICFDLPRLSEDLDFDIKNYSQFDQKAIKKFFCPNGRKRSADFSAISGA